MIRSHERDAEELVLEVSRLQPFRGDRFADADAPGGEERDALFEPLPSLHDIASFLISSAVLAEISSI